MLRGILRKFTHAVWDFLENAEKNFCRCVQGQVEEKTGTTDS